MDSEALLPVIAFSHELKPGTSEWDSVRARVQQALQEYGTFQALFDVSSELRKSFCGAVEEMFELPLHTKSQIISDKEVLGTVYTAYSPKKTWESMDIEDVLVPEIFRNFTDRLWPEGNPCFGKTVVSFSEQVSGIDQMIRGMVLESFGLEKYFDEHKDSSRYALRLTKYEGSKSGESKRSLVPHTDKNFLTILYEVNEVGGLEVQTNDGKWINVKFSPNTFIVLPGDSLHAWTNGLVQAPIHQVVMTGNEPRYSAGLFSSPKEGTIIKVPDELVDEQHPLRFKPYEFSEYMRCFKTEKGKKIYAYGVKAFYSV